MKQGKDSRDTPDREGVISRRHNARPEDPLPKQGARFSPHRERVASAAEHALALALRRAGRQVRWEEIHQAWEGAHGVPGPYGRGMYWRWIFEPSLEQGRVLKTKQGACVYYTLRDGPPYSLPGRARFSAFRLADCDTAERALALALSRAGCQVGWPQIHAAWPDVVPATRQPRAIVQVWSRIFEPALAAGRVIATRRRGWVYYTLANSPEYAIPESSYVAPRVIGSAVRMRLEATARVVAWAADEAGALVDLPGVRTAWAQAGGPEPVPHASTLARDLRLAAEQGGIRQVIHQERYFYGPANRPELEPPLYASDLRRVQTALARAVQRLQSAVLCEEIEREIERDPELRLRTDVTIAGALASLRQWRRAHAIRHLGRNSGYYYWTLPNGSRWVRSEAEHHFDRRYRAVLGLWGASGGRPFTTKAVRLYASARPGLRTQDPHLMAWTNALTQFRDNGDLVVVRVEGSRLRRWAVASQWNTLSEEEQRERLRDRFGREIDPEALPATQSLGVRPEATVHDVQFEAKSRNLRAVVLLAKALRAKEEPDPERRRILRTRPVTVEELSQALALRPWLKPSDRPLAVDVADATRRRKGIQAPALASVGVVKRLRFVDVRDTPAARAYVDYRAALAAADLRSARRRLRKVQRAADESAMGVIPLPAAVIDARVHLLASDLRCITRQLVRAARRAELYSEERSEVLAILRSLRQSARDAAVLATVLGTATAAEFVEQRGLMVDMVVQQVAGLLEPRQGASAIKRQLQVAGTVPPSEDAVQLQRARKRRRYKHLVDRVGFACYCAARWGGPSLASLAQQAIHAMGELRTPGPFLEALMDPAATPTHASAAAVLGFFDDRPGRAALVRYLWRFIAEPGRVGQGATIVAAETALLGLAPLAFGGIASELRDDEREVLLEAARSGADERVRWVAARVLRSWDEAWDRDRLLFL